MTTKELEAQIRAYIGDDDFFPADEFAEESSLRADDWLFDREHFMLWFVCDDGLLSIPFHFGADDETRLDLGSGFGHVQATHARNAVLADLEGVVTRLSVLAHDARAFVNRARSTAMKRAAEKK